MELLEGYAGCGTDRRTPARSATKDCDGQVYDQSQAADAGPAGGSADNPTGSSPGDQRFVYCDDWDPDGVLRDD